jgi:YHS domain-containing protein
MRITRVAAVVVSFGLVASALGAPPERTLVFDPVELVAGREAEGDGSLAVEHEGYEYRFVSRENLARFLDDPWRFAAADGGACGRMGPLSGLGDARRHLVVDGRIWFFASDGCRDGFRADPERCIERADPVPVGDDDERARAAEVLSRMVAWAGGRDAVGAVRSYRHAIRDEFEREGGTGEHVKEVRAAFPDRFLASDRWDERSWSRCVVGDRGLARSPDGAAPLARDRTAAFSRRMARLPISLIVLGADPDAVAFARGGRRVRRRALRRGRPAPPGRDHAALR